MSISLAAARPLSRPTLVQVERALLALAVGLAGGLIWLCPRPPMIDLPQHAAQVALWRDLITGVTPWSDLVRINLLTPYLIGYSLTLPLSFVLPLAVAVKIVLTTAFLAFVSGCLALRASLDGNPRLDWLFLFGFFGFAFDWGFLTFLVAAPVGLWFLVLANAQARRPTVRGALGLFGLGLLLLFSHGLVFLMGVTLGGLLALWRQRARGFVKVWPTLLPYVGLGLALGAFRLATAHQEGALQFDVWRYGMPVWLRPLAALTFVSDTESHDNPALLLAGLAMLLTPIHWRMALNRNGAPLLFAGVAAIFLLVPSYAFQTAFLFNRFALFLLPFYALMFGRAERPLERRDLAAGLCMAIATFAMLGLQASRLLAFAEESRDFETVLAAAQPGHRALGVIYDKDSPGALNSSAYMHFPLWYQADRHGFVDFNFAVFPPQVVRFRSDRLPNVNDQLGWMPSAFDWQANDGPIYDYFFVRGTPADVATLKRATPCGLDDVARDGRWFLLSRPTVPCQARP